MSAIKGSYYPPEIIDTDGNIENEGVYGKNTPFVSDDHMGIINLQGANIDYLKTAVDNLGSNTTAAQNQLQTNIDTNNTNQTKALNTVKTDLTNLINSNKSTQDAKNTAYDSHLSTLDSKTDTNASNTLVNLTTNGNSLRAVKGGGTNVDVVVPYAVGTTQANPKNLGNYTNNNISAVRDLLNNELADMNTKGCSVRFIRFGANLTTIYNNWAKNWDATMPPWGLIFGVLSLLSDDTYANVELVGYTGTTVLLQRIAGNWKTAETKVYTNGMLNVADTLKIQSTELTLDMGGGTQTYINIGSAPKNYSGSGYAYKFYNGKNSLADMVAKTQAVTDNSNNVATTAFVQTAVANLVSSAPATLNTLNELATALGDDPNFATTVSNNIGAIDTKANTNASNITALQTSDNAKFKAVSVSNDTLTFTKGDNTISTVTVNNVANATNATNAVYASRMHLDLGSFVGKTIADLRTALMSAATSIGNGNTGYVSFSAKLSNLVSGWDTTTTTLTAGGGYCTVRISNVAASGSGYFHGTIYTYDAPEYTFSVIYGVWSSLNRNLVQSDYDTLNSAITTTNTNLSSLSSTVTSNKSAQDTKNSSYESRLTAVESKGTTNATNATNASYTTTQAATDNSTKIASTAFVQTAVANIVNGAPSTLDTLNELANALGNDPNFATTVSKQLGQKANKTDVDNQMQNVNTQLSQAITTLQNGVVSSIEGKKGEVNLWDVLHRYGENYVPADTSNIGWNSLGVCIIYYTQNMIKNQPTQFGQLINIPANKDTESMQIWVSQYDGNMYTRGGDTDNSVNDRAFIPVGREDRVYLTNGAQIWVE